LELDDNFTKDNKDTAKFWKSSTSGSGFRNLKQDSSTLQDWAFFHILAHFWKKGHSDPPVASLVSAA